MIELTEREFHQLVEYMKSHYGINLSQKRTLIVGRMQNYLNSAGYNSFSDYLKYLKHDQSGEEMANLVNRLTTNHTYFMREPEHFELYKSKVLPALAAREADKRDLRIWSAGCSSGEEPYTLAMINRDYFGLDKENWDCRILATDISTKVLETAVQGAYHNDSVSALPKHWQLTHFRKVDAEKSVLTDVLRRDVIFRRMNLMEKIFPFKKKFHVIFCRNVMIYFDSETKNALAQKFYDWTEPGGYLFIGHSESLDRRVSPYKYIQPAVYRKE